MKITARLALIYSAAMAGFLVLFCVVTVYFFKASLISEFDRSLEERFAYLERHLERKSDGSVSFRGSDHPNQVKIKGVNDPVYVEVWSDEGLIFRNTDVPLKEEANGAIVSSFLAKNGLRLRMMVKPVSGGLLIHAAFDEARVAARVSELVWLFTLLAPLGILVIAGISYFSAKRALAPVKAMTEEARRMTARSLGRRFEIDRNDELGELAEVFNDLFSRIEASFTALKRFTSDASHELRTPLTAIRSTCQVAIQSDKSADEYKKTLEGVLDEIRRITDLVDSLLMLTRGDAGAVQLNKTSVPLEIVAAEVRNLLSVLAEEKGQRIELSGVNVNVMADPILIRQAVMSLLHNAISYSPRNTVIELVVSRSKDMASISVLDEGPGISKEHQSRIFDRFYRVDPTRTRENGGGAGLGLSIVKWIGKIHGGNVSVSKNPSGGSTFQINLPTPL